MNAEQFGGLLAQIIEPLGIFAFGVWLGYKAIKKFKKNKAKQSI